MLNLKSELRRSCWCRRWPVFGWIAAAASGRWRWATSAQWRRAGWCW